MCFVKVFIKWQSVFGNDHILYDIWNGYSISKYQILFNMKIVKSQETIVRYSLNKCIILLDGGFAIKRYGLYYITRTREWAVQIVSTLLLLVLVGRLHSWFGFIRCKYKFGILTNFSSITMITKYKIFYGSGIMGMMK